MVLEKIKEIKKDLIILCNEINTKLNLINNKLIELEKLEKNGTKKN